MRVESLRLSLLPARLTQNATERQRQGTLAQAAKERSKLATCSLDGAGDDGPFETVDLGSTAAIYDAVSELHWRARLDRWMVNEGSRVLSYAVWVFLNLLVLAFGLVHYGLKDNLDGARAIFGRSFAVARASALMLHIDAIVILLPMCRSFISLLRRSPLNDLIPFERSIDFHQKVGWSIALWSIVHIVAHTINFARLASSSSTGFGGFLRANFVTGPGLTGWVMAGTLGTMVWFALERNRRRPNGGYERFWYTHHLFVVFFAVWQLHGMFCMIKPDRPPFCSFMSIGVFWKFWLPGGLLYIGERLLREVRGRQRTFISKVIAHPSGVCEVQIKKEHFSARAGQYIMLNCPEISYYQNHPFTLTSAPEEDYLSIHIRVVGDWTTAFASALGCNFAQDDGCGSADEQPSMVSSGDGKRRTTVAGAGKDGKLGGGEGELVLLPLNVNLPRVMVDGPFGSASEDFDKYETVLLVGAGIGVTPFASILKSIWYRMNGFGNSKATRLSKVYFVWVIRDFGTAEWFNSLLCAIEEQDSLRRIDVSIYLTAKVQHNEMHNILVQDVGADKDTITSLRAPTHYGRPNWDRLFLGIAEQHPDTDVGVFFCGPPALGTQLHGLSNKYTRPGRGGTRFFFGKENF